MSATLDVALEHALRGWPVMPLRADGSMPSRAGTWPEAATSEAVIVGHWFHHDPGAGLAIATGKRSGLAVVAVRGEAGAIALRELGEMPATRVTTWGASLLFWFALPRRAPRIPPAALPAGRVRQPRGRDLPAGIVPSSTDWVAVGVRVIAEGGWVAAPPTRGCRVVVDVEPAPVPAWLLLEASPSSFPPDAA